MVLQKDIRTIPYLFSRVRRPGKGPFVGRNLMVQLFPGIVLFCGFLNLTIIRNIGVIRVRTPILPWVFFYATSLFTGVFVCSYRSSSPPIGMVSLPLQNETPFFIFIGLQPISRRPIYLPTSRLVRDTRILQYGNGFPMVFVPRTHDSHHGKDRLFQPKERRTMSQNLSIGGRLPNNTRQCTMLVRIQILNVLRVSRIRPFLRVLKRVKGDLIFPLTRRSKVVILPFHRLFQFVNGSPTFRNIFFMGFRYIPFFRTSNGS